MPIYKTGTSKNGKQGYRVVVNYSDVNGDYKKKTKLVYGSQEAKDCEALLQKEVTENPASSGMTVNELFEEYIKAKRQEVRETSLSKTESILSRDVIPDLKNFSLKKLDIKTLQKWKENTGERELAISTKKHIYREFFTMLNYAVKMGYLPSNPLIRVGNFKDVYFEKPQDKLRYYTPSQFSKYINVAKDSCTSLSDYNYYVFFNIAYFTGMRKGEINALKWSDIEGNILHVRRSVSQKIKGKKIVETPPKNRSSYRDIQLPKNLIEILDEHKKRWMHDKNFTEDYRVCGGTDCLSDTGIENRNTLYAKLAELEHIKIHDFRHSHASLLANEGINIQEIARRLGHSKIEMTWNTYSHLYPREEERAVKILEKIGDVFDD